MIKFLIKAISLSIILATLFIAMVMPAVAGDKIDESSPILGGESKSSTSNTQGTQSTSSTSNTLKAGTHYHYFGSQLDTPQERQLYSVIENELVANKKSTTSVIQFEPALKLNVAASASDQVVEREAAKSLKRALDAFKFDHPQMYWITGNSTLANLSVRVYNDGGIYLHSASAYFELDSTKAGDGEKINSVVNSIVAEAKKQTTDYARIQMVHNMVAKQITYGAESSYRGFQVTGGLVDGVGTCEAYSKSVKLVLDKLGYENVLVAGTGINNGKKIPHMWNYVKINGSWYAIDTTWDDQKVLLTDYLLVGKNTVAPNFNGRTFGQDHIEEYTFSHLDYKKFYYPKLSVG